MTVDKLMAIVFYSSKYNCNKKCYTFRILFIVYDTVEEVSEDISDDVCGCCKEF